MPSILQNIRNFFGFIAAPFQGDNQTRPAGRERTIEIIFANSTNPPQAPHHDGEFDQIQFVNPNAHGRCHDPNARRDDFNLNGLFFQRIWPEQAPAVPPRTHASRATASQANGGRQEDDYAGPYTLGNTNQPEKIVPNPIYDNTSIYDEYDNTYYKCTAVPKDPYEYEYMGPADLYDAWGACEGPADNVAADYDVVATADDPEPIYALGLSVEENEARRERA